ncbi:hypothetical protein Pint_28033 [Pistacia integerrima]|uniref:Uncharacterized protein n=1 Tax=Pistacia integerrima TaxID=434235 RepID=A0ACC0YSL0_9ROSI|nr:hypothetical protein Pint_28033 [Pistacia integerrima]
MEIQESYHRWHESWPETDSNPGSNRVRYSGPLSDPMTSNSKKTHCCGKKTTIICDSSSSTTLFADNEERRCHILSRVTRREGAFLVAAREFGFEFRKRTQSSVFIREIYHSSGQPTQREYKILNLLDFTSKRKLMSGIVRDEDGQIILFCKGADSIIFYRLSKNGRMYEEVTTRHLNEYGEVGLLTLALAYRKLDESEYTSWNHEFLKATQYQSANIIKCYWDWRLGCVFGAGVVGLEVGFVGGGEGCIEAAGVGVFVRCYRLIFSPTATIFFTTWGYG